MKHIFVAVVLALLFATVVATPAFAQGPRASDHVCTGGSVVLNSEDVVGNLILFGCGARISSGARVQRDVVSFGGQVVLEPEAQVGRSVVVFGSRGPVQIAGTLGQDVVVFGAGLTLESSAVVGHDVTVVGGAIDRKAGAVVRGRTDRGGPTMTIPPAPPAPPLPPSPNVRVSSPFDFFGILRSIITGFLFTLGLVAVGMLTVSFWPSQTQQVGRVALDSALPSLGVGCLTQIVTLTLGIALVITLCGIPIAAVMFIALALAWLVGWIAIGQVAGSKILNPLNVRESLKTPVVAVIVGIVLLALISLAPIIGWFVSGIAATIGIGAVVLSRFGTRSYPTTPSALPPATTNAPPANVTST